MGENTQNTQLPTLTNTLKQIDELIVRSQVSLGCCDLGDTIYLLREAKALVAQAIKQSNELEK